MNITTKYSLLASINTTPRCSFLYPHSNTPLYEYHYKTLLSSVYEYHHKHPLWVDLAQLWLDLAQVVVLQLQMLRIPGLILPPTQTTGLVAWSCNPASGGQGYEMVGGV